MIAVRYGECIVLQDGPSLAAGGGLVGLWAPDPTGDERVSTAAAIEALHEAGQETPFPAWDYLTAEMDGRLGELILWTRTPKSQLVLGGDARWRGRIEEYGNLLDDSYGFAFVSESGGVLYRFDCSKQKVAV